MSEEEKEAILNTKKKIETTQKGLNDNKYYGERFNLEQEIKREQILLNLIEKQNKVIDLMLQDIESEYLGTSYMEYYSLENYYRRAEEEE